MPTLEPYDESMKLPSGQTCADCAHAKRCIAFGFTWATRTSCDFYPSRAWFEPKPTGEN